MQERIKMRIKKLMSENNIVGHNGTMMTNNS